MGVADLQNACRDWSSVKKCRPTVHQDVGDKMTPTFFVCRRHFSASVNSR